MNQSCLTTEYYSTCQEREKAFAAKVKGMVPTRIFGPRQFWQEFNNLIKGKTPFELPAVHIPADPRQCLAFNSPRQVLLAAVLACNSSKKDKSATVAKAASVFGLDKIMDRPIRCLSGGEAAKTALAKAWAAAATGRPLVMASPSGWLSAANSGLLDQLVQRYTTTCLPVTIMAMEGENDCRQTLPRRNTVPGPVLNLETCRLEIDLGRSISTLTGTRAFCQVADIRAGLPSPCLVSGDNGQGKSILAKAMAGVLSTRGRLHLECAGKYGPARLIFQDVVSQALMRSCSQILESGSRLLCKRAAVIFRQLETSWKANYNHPKKKPDNLVRIKLALAAVRLASNPPVLILDEPDWSLNRRSADAIVTAIIDKAHKMKTATVIISHRPWWHRLAASRLVVRKTAGSPDRPGHLFTIGLRAATCPDDPGAKP